MDLITLRTTQATATISPYGAQVMSFIHNGQPDILWQTTPDFLTKAISNHKALRGGIPLCWPWFLAHPTMPEAPSHGLGRTMLWTPTEQTENTATFTCLLDGTHPAWPYRTEGKLTVSLTDTLTVSLTTTNLSDIPFKLTQALHTYLRVADITTASVTGTQGLTRRHVSSGTPMPPAPSPFTIGQEVEDLIHPVTGPLTITDPTLNRTLTVTNRGTDETVIWNPWAEKAAKLDMPPTGYTEMLCLEAANIDHAQTLQPGESHTLTTILSAAGL